MTETTDQIGAFIEVAKQELCSPEAAKKHFNAVQTQMQRTVDKLFDEQQKGITAVPELQYRDIAENKVSNKQIVAIRERGCVIIRKVFPHTQAQEWNQELGEYLDNNDYPRRAREMASLDNYFGDLADATPQIFGVYWSRPQVLARQAESMAVSKRFLNRLWDTSAPAGPEFDPDLDYSYADRTRRRAPGDTTLGLSPHMDAGSYERWVDPAFQKIYAPIFAGQFSQYDPWHAAYRTQTREFVSPAVSSMFRTFQGWTALTEQGPDDGTLELLPISNAIAYVLLRALQQDVPANELCLARPGRALGIDAKWHPDLIPGMRTIQSVAPGDTVWWHPDVVHAVGNEHHGQDYASVIYIGASPACAKNRAYALRQLQRFKTGESAPDFAAENYETNFVGRATENDLTELGKRQMALL